MRLAVLCDGRSSSYSPSMATAAHGCGPCGHMVKRSTRRLWCGTCATAACSRLVCGLPPSFPVEKAAGQSNGSEPNTAGLSACSLAHLLAHLAAAEILPFSFLLFTFGLDYSLWVRPTVHAAVRSVLLLVGGAVIDMQVISCSEQTRPR